MSTGLHRQILVEKLCIWHSSVNERLYSCQSPGICGSALGLLVSKTILWDGLGSLSVQFLLIPPSRP